MASQTARAGAYAAARANEGNGIEAAHNGPLGVADKQTRKASLQSLGGLRLLRTRCHVLGIGDMRCDDKELRQ